MHLQGYEQKHIPQNDDRKPKKQLLRLSRLPVRQQVPKQAADAEQHRKQAEHDRANHELLEQECFVTAECQETEDVGDDAHHPGVLPEPDAWKIEKERGGGDVEQGEDAWEESEEHQGGEE